MSLALAMSSRPVALELLAVLRDLDPSRFRMELEATVRRRIEHIEAQLLRLIDAAKAEPTAGATTLPARLRDVYRVLREKQPAPDLAATARAPAWNGYRAALVLAYDELSACLRLFAVRVPNVRPTNYARTSFHAIMGTSVLALLELVLNAEQRWMLPLAISSVFWFLEGLRRVSPGANDALMKALGLIAHPHERRKVNSSTWYATALTILGLGFRIELCAIAVAILAFADPAAGLVGRRFGSVRLVQQKSLEGTLAFFVVGTLAALSVLSIWHPMPLTSMLAIAACASFAAALTELFSQRIDDNFSVPLGAALGGYLALAWIGGV